MENRHFHRLRLVWAVAVCGICASQAVGARAEDDNPETTQARELFQSGVEHYEANQFSQALADFERAYALKPHPLVQVNIANCYDRLNQPAEALTHFEAFIASSEGSAAQRDEVRGAMARLAKAAGRLSIHASPAAAQGVIDGQRTAQALQWVSAGRHKIDFSAEGYEPAVRVVEVPPGETVDVKIDLALRATPVLPPEAATQLAQPPPTAADADAASDSVPPATSAAVSSSSEPAASSPTQPASTGLPANVWISGGATFGLGVIAVVTGQLALAANREFETNLNALHNSSLTEYQRAGAWARGVDAADRADALAAVTDILLAFTFVGAGLTTYFYLVDRNDSERQRMRVAFRADSKSGQLQLRGNF